MLNAFYTLLNLIQKKFIKNDLEFNYSYFIEEYYNNDEALNKLYITNNIIESLHSKINNFRQNTISNKLL